jgi:hypothetical protein
MIYIATLSITEVVCSFVCYWNGLSIRVYWNSLFFAWYWSGLLMCSLLYIT